MYKCILASDTIRRVASFKTMTIRGYYLYPAVSIDSKTGKYIINVHFYIPNDCGKIMSFLANDIVFHIKIFYRKHSNLYSQRLWVFDNELGVTPKFTIS